MMKKWICSIFLLFLMASLISADPASFDLKLKLENKLLFEDENQLSGLIEVDNQNSYPLLDAQVILQLVPQSETDSVVVAQKIISFSYLESLSAASQPFNLEISSDLAAGTYELQAFLYASRDYPLGVPFIFVNAVSQTVHLNRNSTAGVPFIEKALILNYKSILGPSVEKGQLVPVSLSISNPQEKTAYKLRTVYCNWSDLECNSAINSTNLIQESVQTINLSSNQLTEINWNLNAPQEAGVYALRFELLDAQNDTVLSFARGRLVVKGVSARIRSFSATKSTFKEGLVQFPTAVSSFADKKNGVPTGILRFSVQSLDSADSLTLTNIPFSISNLNNPFFYHVFEANLKNTSSLTSACVEVEIDSKIVDAYCLTFNDELTSKRNSFLNQFDINAYRNQSTVFLSACSSNEVDVQNIKILVMDQNKQIISDQLSWCSLAPELFKLDRASPFFILKVTDFKNSFSAVKRFDVIELVNIEEQTVGKPPIIPNNYSDSRLIQDLILVVALLVILFGVSRVILMMQQKKRGK